MNEVIYISGDTWNENPIALKCVERLFCKNTRAALDLTIQGCTSTIALVPVAAILVASIRLSFLVGALGLNYRGPNRIPVQANFRRGEEIGYFERGSTIIVLASRGFRICNNVETGATIRMGQPLLRLT